MTYDILMIAKRQKENRMRIALCDDQPEELSHIAEMTEKYLLSRGLFAQTETFTHPDELLQAVGKKSYHLYLLDIVMPMLNGIELGKEIRRLDRESQIIFITTEPQFALQSFSVSPANYLVKPVGWQLFYEAMDRAVSRLDPENERSVTIKTADGLRVIPFSEIACCEYQKHQVIYATITGETIRSLVLRESFSGHIRALLSDHRFIQTHSAFLINMSRVMLFRKDSFTLRGGAVVPISAGYYPKVRDCYMNYLKEMQKDERTGP